MVVSCGLRKGRGEKDDDWGSSQKNIYGTILCIDKFRARLQLILFSGGKGDKKGR
jgi:hypothetical protein